MNKKTLIQLVICTSIFLSACSSTPSTPEAIACKELRETSELLSEMEDKRLQDSFSNPENADVLKEQSSIERLAAYQGFARRYTSKVNDPELKELLKELLKTTLGSDEYKIFNGIKQFGVINDWCDAKKI
jgi:hypothetical protein